MKASVSAVTSEGPCLLLRAKGAAAVGSGFRFWPQYSLQGADLPLEQLQYTENTQKRRANLKGHWHWRKEIIYPTCFMLPSLYWLWCFSRPFCELFQSRTKSFQVKKSSRVFVVLVESKWPRDHLDKYQSKRKGANDTQWPKSMLQKRKRSPPFKATVF